MTNIKHFILTHNIVITIFVDCSAREIYNDSYQSITAQYHTRDLLILYRKHPFLPLIKGQVYNKSIRFTLFFYPLAAKL